MKKRKTQSVPDDVEGLKKEISTLRNETVKLQEEIYRLRLERVVLEKEAEIIKKDQGANLKDLTNREKVTMIDALRDRYRLKDLLSVFELAKSS